MILPRASRQLCSIITTRAACGARCFGTDVALTYLCFNAYFSVTRGDLTTLFIPISETYLHACQMYTTHYLDGFPSHSWLVSEENGWNCDSILESFHKEKKRV